MWTTVATATFLATSTHASARAAHTSSTPRGSTKQIDTRQIPLAERHIRAPSTVLEVGASTKRTTTIALRQHQRTRQRANSIRRTVIHIIASLTAQSVRLRQHREFGV